MRISVTNRSANTAGAARKATAVSRDRAGGFTLIEVVLALSIIGLLAALGLPYVRLHAGTPALRVKAFEIATLLRTERNAALRFGRPTVVLVDPGRRMMQSAISQGEVVLPSSMTMRIVPEGLRGVQFFADGSASGALVSVSSGNTTFVIGINSVTAAVSTSSAP